MPELIQLNILAPEGIMHNPLYCRCLQRDIKLPRRELIVAPLRHHKDQAIGVSIRSSHPERLAQHASKIGIIHTDLAPIAEVQVLGIQCHGQMARRLLHVQDIVADIVVIDCIQLRSESVGDSTEGQGPFVVSGMVCVKARCASAC